MNIEYVRLCACLREYHDVTPLSITITILALINLSCMVSIHNHTHTSQNKTPAAGEKTNMFECFHSKLVTFVFKRHDSPWVAMDYLYLPLSVLDYYCFFCLLYLMVMNWIGCPLSDRMWFASCPQCVLRIYILRTNVYVSGLKFFDRDKCLCSHGCGNLLFHASSLHIIPWSPWPPWPLCTSRVPAGSLGNAANGQMAMDLRDTRLEPALAGFICLFLVGIFWLIILDYFGCVFPAVHKEAYGWICWCRPTNGTKSTITEKIQLYQLQLLDSCLFFWTMRPRALFYVVPPSLEKRM